MDERGSGSEGGAAVFFPSRCSSGRHDRYSPRMAVFENVTDLFAAKWAAIASVRNRMQRNNGTSNRYICNKYKFHTLTAMATASNAEKPKSLEFRLPPLHHGQSFP